jgi:small-conductance mechanosensitive channel
MQEEKNLVEEQVEDGEVVEVEMPEEEADESAAVEDVSEEEQAKDEDKDELENYSKNVQKRIATLTKKMREQERAAQSAYEYAKSLQEENNHLKTSNSEAHQNYYSEAENRLKSQRAQANAVLKSAYQEQDWDKVTKAQEILDKITVEESKLVNTKIKVEEAPQAQYQNYVQQYQQPVQQAAPDPDPAAQDWAEKNQWFGEDETMTLAAFNIHRKLIEEEGFDPADSMYYDEIDKRIRVEFPHKFEDGGEVKPKQKMQQTVAPAVRSEGSGRKRQVRLTKSEVEMARRLNVPVQEYAKHIKR